MKSIKRTTKALMAAGAMCMAASAWSYSVQIGSNTIDVGGLDAFINITTAPANENNSTVLAWGNTYINPDASTLVRTSPATYYRAIGSTSVYAIALTGTPDYFHLFNANYDALYQNNGTGSNALSWAVFDLADDKVCKNNPSLTCYADELGAKLNISGLTGTISHIDSIGTHTSVPEPGSLGLVAAGLAGLAWARRRQAKA